MPNKCDYLQSDHCADEIQNKINGKANMGKKIFKMFWQDSSHI